MTKNVHLAESNLCILNEQYLYYY